jgi:hypothetical protein
MRDEMYSFFDFISIIRLFHIHILRFEIAYDLTSHSQNLSQIFKVHKEVSMMSPRIKEMSKRKERHHHSTHAKSGGAHPTTTTTTKGGSEEAAVSSSSLNVGDGLSPSSFAVAAGGKLAKLPTMSLQEKR